MNGFFSLIVFLGVGQSWAVKHPSVDDVKLIQKYLDEAKNVETRNKGIDELEKALNDPSLKLKRISKETIALEQAIAVLKRERDVARDKAVHVALVAYGIVPVDSAGKAIIPTGTVVASGPFKGKQPVWIPIAAENEERTAQGKKGESITIPKAKPDPVSGYEPTAATGRDGVTRIYDRGAFASPAFLASTLIHELTHFKQFVTPGQGDRFGRAQREVKAFQAELANINLLGFAPDQMEFQLNRLLGTKGADGVRRNGLIDMWTGRAEQEKNSGKEFVEDFKEASPSDDELEALKKRADDIEAIVAREREVVRKQRETLEDDRRLHAFLMIANKACDEGDSPPNIMQEELDRLPAVKDVAACLGVNKVFEEDRCTRSVLDALCVSRHGDFMRTPEFIKSTARQTFTVRPQPPQLREAAVDYRKLGLQLVALAKKACDGPGSITEKDLEPINRWFPDPANSLMIRGDLGLSGCSWDLYRYLRHLNDAWVKGFHLPLDWVNHEARRFKRENAGTASSPSGNSVPQGPSDPPPSVPGRGMGRNTGGPNMPRISDPFPH